MPVRGPIFQVLNRCNIDGFQLKWTRMVKRRKISGGTRSENGRRGRDTFASIKKTCRKLKVSFWEFLNDRVGNKNLIPPLPKLIECRAQST
jgi:hypothetical protein